MKFLHELKDQSETVMLLVILVISIFFFVGSFQYSPEAARFPQITSGLAIIGVVLILFSNYLPAPLTRFVEEPIELVSEDDALEDIDVDDMNTKSTEQESPGPLTEPTEEVRNRPINDMFFTAILALGYVLLGYLIGYLWVSPLFVLVYGWWFQLSKSMIALLAGLAFVIGYTFMSILNISIDTGVLI